MNQFPLAPEYPGAISNFYENTHTYLRLCVYCQCQQVLMLTTPAINLSLVTMTSALLIAGKNSTSYNSSSVTTTPSINLSPMSTTLLDEYQSDV
jgi:hypothetical protein